MIKIISPILMICAIFLDIEGGYLWLNHTELPNFMIFLMIIGTIALVIHTIEGAIAFFLARKKGLNPLQSGIYTFLVGTIALFELFQKD